MQALGDPAALHAQQPLCSAHRNAFVIEQFDCGNAVVAHAISRSGFGYRKP